MGNAGWIECYTPSMPVLRVDEEVHSRVTEIASLFRETPNRTLRRLLQLEDRATSTKSRRETEMPRRSERFREHIGRALISLGGSAKTQDVLAKVEASAPLTPDDWLGVSSTNEPRWRNDARWERNAMKEDGLIRPDSPRGIWELSPSGVDWAEGLDRGT